MGRTSRRRPLAFLVGVGLGLVIVCGGCSGSNSSTGTLSNYGYAYVLNQLSRDITRLERTAAQTLRVTGTTAIDGHPVDMTISPIGTVLAVLEDENDRLLIYDIGLDGGLTLRETVPTADAPVSVWIFLSDPLTVFVGCADGTVQLFGQPQGRQLMLQHTTDIGGSATDILYAHDLFVTDGNENQIDQFIYPFNASAGPTDMGSEPWAMARSGNRLAVTSLGTSSVSLFEIQNSGSDGGPHPLRLIQTEGTGQVPVDVAMTDVRRSLYTANLVDNTITQFRLVGDLNNLTLEYHEPSSVETGPAPTSLTIFPDYPLEFTVVTCFDDDQLYLYEPHTDGRLSFLRHMPVGDGPIRVEAAVRNETRSLP